MFVHYQMPLWKIKLAKKTIPYFIKSFQSLSISCYRRLCVEEFELQSVLSWHESDVDLKMSLSFF